MRSIFTPRRPNSLYASLLLAVSVAGVVLAPFTAGSPARRVRVGGTRGAGVIHQVRVEPYGRAAAEHAYFDDDEDEALLAAARHGAAGTSSHEHAPPVFLLPTAEIHLSAVASSPRLDVESSFTCSPSCGVPSGRAPPLA